VDIQEIDILHVEPRERLVDLVEYVLARQAAIIGPTVAHAQTDLGRHNDLVTLGILFQRLAGDRLGIPVIVVVRRVEEVDALFHRHAEEGLRSLLINHPGVSRPTRRAETHATKTKPRYLQTRFSQPNMVHASSPLAFALSGATIGSERPKGQ